MLPGALDQTAAYYQPIYLQCQHTDMANKTMTRVTIVLILVPLIITILANSLILILIKGAQTTLSKHRHEVKPRDNKAAVTVVSMCSVFILSYVPFIVLFLMMVSPLDPPIWLLTFCQFSGIEKNVCFCLNVFQLKKYFLVFY